MLELRTLENSSIQQITNTFNKAFSSYSIPIVFTEEQFEIKFATESIQLDLSVGVFDNETLVALILHFVNIKNGEIIVYNGGTGVIPEFRGQQLTSKMYDFILPILKKQQVNKLILEVFTDNFSALKIYQNQGFTIRREVSCFKGKLIPRPEKELDSNFQIVELSDVNWEIFKTFWDFPPTWQNSISTINNLLKQLLVLGVRNESKTVGYLIYNPKIKRIHQLAIAKEYRNIGLGSRLLNHISIIQKGDVSLINIDIRTENINDFILKRGLLSLVNQFEMEMDLT